MTIHYNVTGERRKELVDAIVAITKVGAVYMKAPTFSYQIDYFNVSRDGTLTFDDMADSEEVENLLEGLAQRGFVPVSGHPDKPQPPEGTKPQEAPTEAHTAAPDSVTVSYLREALTDRDIENVKKLVEAKGALIEKALGITALPIEVTDSKVSFPWVCQHGQEEGEDDRSYIDRMTTLSEFIKQLVGLAQKLKRVNAKAKEVPNEKYAFRCFLLRLGFIGKEYKKERKILLRGLSGNSAFKEGRKHDSEE